VCCSLYITVPCLGKPHPGVLANDHSLQVLYMVTSEEHRGKGLGTVLVKQLLQNKVRDWCRRSCWCVTKMCVCTGMQVYV
jgi:GNAT superfamily N-acetyltransferase